MAYDGSSRPHKKTQLGDLRDARVGDLRRLPLAELVREYTTFSEVELQAMRQRFIKRGLGWGETQEEAERNADLMIAAIVEETDE